MSLHRKNPFPLYRLAIFVAALACAGCGGDVTGRALVAPGGYGFYNCAQLANQERTLNNRNVELRRLSARAKEGPGGGVISAMTYDPEYETNLGRLYSLRQTQAEKNCPPAAEMPEPSPPPLPRR
jgi:hypothetical protein